MTKSENQKKNQWNDYDNSGPIQQEPIQQEPAPGKEPIGIVMKPMTQYKPVDIRWLEPGRIAMGKLTLIAGDPGLGKSFMTLELAARISRGEIGRVDNGKGAQLTGRAVILSAEDDPGDTLVPRLNAMCARLSRIQFIEGLRLREGGSVDLPQLDRDADLLAKQIQHLGEVSLIVIDPISAYMGRADSHNNAEVRAVLAQLARLASITGAAVVCVTHLNKDSSGKRAVYRAMGSLAFTAAARTVHLVTKLPKSMQGSGSRQYDEHGPIPFSDDQYADRKRVVSMVKNNLGMILPSRMYVIDDGTLVWLDDEIPADADAMEGMSDGQSLIAPDSVTDRAIAFLQDSLGAGERSAGELVELGKARGISATTLTKARKELCVISRKVHHGWVWSLPIHERDFEDATGENPPRGEGDAYQEALYERLFDPLGD